MDQEARWGRITLGFTAATVLIGGATLMVWNRDQRRSSFSVQPSPRGDGGSAMFLTTW